ncbi:MAG: 2-hydroxyacyl-CoA dehydratase family protein [Thermodesulfobacteriota bacterium]
MSVFDITSASVSLPERFSTYRQRIKTFTNISGMGLRLGTRFMMEAPRKYPWLKTLLTADTLFDMSTRARRGPYRQASAWALSEVIASITDMLEGVFGNPEKTVMHEDLVPPEILTAMGLNPWMAELLGIMGPLIRSDFAEEYIDAAENEGTPPDVCSLPKATMGLVLKGQMPHPKAILTSNMPCDGGMSSYTLMEKRLNVPCFRLDVPYNFYDDRSAEYFAKELFRAVDWLEEHTPGRMDWDRLREVCTLRNRATEFQMEVWDLLREKPAPMAGEPLYLGHMIFQVAMPGREKSVRYFETLLAHAKKIRAAGGALPDERYRIALWNPPTLIYPELFAWAEQRYNAVMLMDMISYNRHPYIDTKSPETMMRDLARIIMAGPMARHTRGPQENFFSDLFELCERFSMDMIWMAGHIGCKNTMALSGMFREKCRERGVPLLIINYDLSDTRVVSPAEVRKQAEAFMETVMKAGAPVDSEAKAS